MSKVNVLREQPITPPVSGVVISLSLDEAQELAGILGQGNDLVGGLYWELTTADDAITDGYADAFRRGQRWVLSL